MNTNPWMLQRLNEEHQRQLREVAEREYAARESQNEPAQRPHRRLLTKLYSEMSELAARWEATETVSSRELQRQA